MSVFIAAEMSANHLGSLDRAKRIVHAAAAAGANGIKLQTWEPDTMCLDREYMLEDGPWKGRRLIDLYREAYTPWEWHAELFELARSLGLEPFSSPFDVASVDFLETLGVKRYKVASFEAEDATLLRRLARTKKPCYVSGALRAQWNKASDWLPWDKFIPVSCVSAYPSSPSDVQFGGRMFRWGLSDHSEGIGVAVAAVAYGACYIEKHLTMSRADGGPDSGFSMEPAEFKAMVKACRQAYEATFGTSDNSHQDPSRKLMRSWWATRPIEAGEAFTPENTRTARPATGISASVYLHGEKASQHIPARWPIREGDVA